MENFITREQFLADVRHEIDSLKANATPSEIAKLDIYNFNFNSPRNCIYGQMTGRCSTFRAKELMDASCVRVTKRSDDFDGVSYSRGKGFDDIVSHINGDYKGQTWGEKYDETYNRHYGYLSMLELYITLNGANNRNIFEYLKGETEILDLNTID